ncbi:CheY-like superfamily [Scleroderma yunnanense]
MIVLVVDDDRLTRALMSRTLSRLGCSVSTAENGEIALEMIVGRKRDLHAEPSLDCPMEVDESETEPFTYNYDVIFLDNQMPIASGLEVVTKLREMGRQDFVVGVTGDVLVEDQREYLEAGVNHVLTKPVFEASLIEMLSIAEERRRKGCSLVEHS